MAIGYLAVQFVSNVTAPIAANLAVIIASVVVTPFIVVYGVRWALPERDIRTPPLWLRLVRGVVMILVVLASIFGLLQLAALVANIGNALSGVLGPFAFLGNFLFQISEILRVLTPALGALAAGGALGSFFGGIGQRSSERLPVTTVKILNLLLMSVAGALVLGLLGALVEWLYQIDRPLYTLWIPMAVGGGLGLFLAITTKARDTLPTGMVIYTITRTLLNGLRSIEALVMAIVFVIAVGIGPFAGVLALGLHTIVSLGKLYSEQVESIMPGPLEAIEATGANRLQTIIYGVVPQIVPPYISYTMYRWDINVRMSTIIGFVGGGGIGFLLQQNINLLNYRAASAQMLAIAVVVASMDYISSMLRERYV
ncbi:MAG: ABC transporter permease subunit [Anaerolineae bacterium]|nr:ABC transporter permease subunit [Anaerolineae bacterium]